jgi:hypothetical protein
MTPPTTNDHPAIRCDGDRIRIGAQRSRGTGGDIPRGTHNVADPQLQAGPATKDARPAPGRDTTPGHPDRMLPDLAAHAIDHHTRPGDIVLDPMAGVGTTVLEAVRAGHHAAGVEIEAGWRALATANIRLACMAGASGHGRVVQGDATRLPAVLPAARRGQVALVLTSPPHGPILPAAEGLRWTRGDGITDVLAGCVSLPTPRCGIVLATRPHRQRNGQLANTAGNDVAVGRQPVDQRVAAAFITRSHRHLASPRGHRFSTGDRPLMRRVAVGRQDPPGLKPSSTGAESGYHPAPRRRLAPQRTAHSVQSADQIPLRRLSDVPKETPRCLSEYPTGDHCAYATDRAGPRRPR